MDNLKECRDNITEIDAKIAALFEERMKNAKQIAEYKKENGLSVKDETREKELIAHNSKLIEDEDIRSYYVRFLESTLNVSCDYQEMQMNGMKVAYGGKVGAFAHIAAKNLFPKANLISMHDFNEAYESVEKGINDCAVLPLENSMAGDVGTVMDLMFQGSLHVRQVYDLQVRHHLLGLPGAKREDIKSVYSHPQAIAQCSNYLGKQNITTFETANTSLGAAKVKESGDKSIAAIASEETAEAAGLTIIDSDIQNNGINTTRFAVFSRVAEPDEIKTATGDENFIIMFTVKNEAGALAATLNIIGAHGYNMKSLKSRPLKSLPWNYYFYIEAEGNIHSRNGQAMMQELSALCAQLKMVGTYKSGE
ncbi:MAG: bifunctional chorismate mutase/prephenate dehydratase [Lachnospiraceae bacterium]|nr:bifunctional chorismate mutase/prephenate dehydratase [Lachnospiraceae bacterium]